MVEMGTTKINVKDELTIDFIVSRYDLVFSLHCKQIFPNRLVENVRCVNFHPGLNPYNRGWYPQAFSIINGLPAGATIHLMDAEVDHGDIIAQKTVSIEPSDTSYEVYRKVISAEKYLIKKNIRKIIEGAYYSFAPKKDGNYNSVKDYRKICELQLDSVDTLQSHINLLRATTHGAFKNAFFVDKNGLKYYVKISIERA
jgi:methionyl-tRNA formyltransferase